MPDLYNVIQLDSQLVIFEVVLKRKYTLLNSCKQVYSSKDLVEVRHRASGTRLQGSGVGVTDQRAGVNPSSKESVAGIQNSPAERQKGRAFELLLFFVGKWGERFAAVTSRQSEQIEYPLYCPENTYIQQDINNVVYIVLDFKGFINLLGIKITLQRKIFLRHKHESAAYGALHTDGESAEITGGGAPVISATIAILKRKYTIEYVKKNSFALEISAFSRRILTRGSRETWPDVSER